LDRLRDAGVSCYKIEGRMRTPYSVGIVVNAYRMAIDGTAPLEELQRELDTISHRPYISGFYLGDPAVSGTETVGLIQDWRFVAQAAADSPNGTALIETRNRIAPGDTLEVVSPGHTGRAFTVEVIRDECGQTLDVANVPMRTVSINCPWPVVAGDLFRARDAQSPRE
jgi:putative protease